MLSCICAVGKSEFIHAHVDLQSRLHVALFLEYHIVMFIDASKCLFTAYSFKVLFSNVDSHGTNGAA